MRHPPDIERVFDGVGAGVYVLFDMLERKKTAVSKLCQRLFIDLDLLRLGLESGR